MEERCGVHFITLLIEKNTQIYTRASVNLRKVAQEVETREQIGVNQRKAAQQLVNMAAALLKNSRGKNSRGGFFFIWAGVVGPEYPSSRVLCMILGAAW